MKYLTALVLFVFVLGACGDSSYHNNEENIKDTSTTTLTKFPTIGFKKVHEKVIPYPVEKVFPLFEPQGRPLLYEKWNPTVLRQGENGSLKGHVEFSKYDELDVFLTVTEYHPENGHIQYLAVWDDFEIQRIDIYCTVQNENKTKVKWVEHNAGLYEKGVSLVSMFVEDGYLIKVVERYMNNVKKRLDNE